MGGFNCCSGFCCKDPVDDWQGDAGLATNGRLRIVFAMGSLASVELVSSYLVLR